MYHSATSTSTSLLRFLVACAVLLLGAVKAGYGQRVYANGYGYSQSGAGGLLGADGYVHNPDNALISPPDNNFTQIEINGLIANNAYAVYQLEFLGNGNLPAGTSVYIKIDNQTSNGLLGLALVTKGLISAYKDANSDNSNLLDGKEVFLSDSDVVIDGEYLIVTSSQCFNAIRISIGSGGLLDLGLLSSGHINIYHGYYECPEITVSVPTEGICEGNEAILTVSNPAPCEQGEDNQGEYLWYDSQDAVTPLGTGSVYNTGPLTETTTVYVEYSGVDNSICGRTPVEVIVHPKPPTPEIITQ